MDVREEAMREIEQAPEEAVAEALDFLRFLTTRAREERFSTAIASEPLLASDWLSAEEDDAWRDL